MTGSLQPYLFENLSRLSGLIHAVFTRHGGVSSPPYDSLNTAFDNGDRPEAVQRNLERVASWTGLECLATTRQVHGDAVLLIDEDAIRTWEAISENGFRLLRGPEADAMVTDRPGVGLMIRIADCQAVFLVDPVKKVVANVHNGWRGSVQNILGRVVTVMKQHYGCRPEDIRAAVSPSLGPCCAEFRNFEDELPESFWTFQVRPMYFDFWQITRHQLMAAGVSPKHIFTAGHCTVCRSDRYFSYRKNKVTGRMAAVIGWVKPS